MRQKAKEIIGFVQDEERLREARKQAKQTRDKYVGYSSEEASSRYSKFENCCFGVYLNHFFFTPSLSAIPPPSPLSSIFPFQAIAMPPSLDRDLNTPPKRLHTMTRTHEGPLAASTMTKRTVTRMRSVMITGQPRKSKQQGPVGRGVDVLFGVEVVVVGCGKARQDVVVPWYGTWYIMPIPRQ